MKYSKEGLREEIRAALLVVPRGRGQLEGFGDNSTVTKNKPAMREIEMGTGTIKIQAEVVKTLSCRSFKDRSIPLPPQAFKYSKLVKVINNAQRAHSDWLRYCYSDGPQLPTRDLLLALLTQFSASEKTVLKPDSIKLIKSLALLACQQKRNQINIGKDLLTQTKIAELSGKSIKTWESNWSKRWKLLLSILEQFDNKGIEHVYESQRKRKTTKRNTTMPMHSRVQPRPTKVVA